MPESNNSEHDETNGGTEEETIDSAHPTEETMSKNQTTSSISQHDETTGGLEEENIDSHHPSEETMSKKQIKRKKKLALAAEGKKLRKQRKKEARHAKAKEQGRDLELERKEQEENRLAGVGRKKRQEAWDKKEILAHTASFRVCLDCSFESEMYSKEINSLASQIRYCYVSNKRTAHPCLLAATSISSGDETLKHLTNVTGFDDWSKRAFTCTDQSLEEYYSENRENLIYLTSDSDNVLEDLDDSKIYVIGGIVDRNRLKNVAFQRAKNLNIATAKLPLDEHLKTMDTTRVLTCNHVFDILLKYREHGKDWKTALMEVLPQRKGAKLAGDDGEEEDSADIVIS
mmetsp:Transcript_33064/g.54606  ORF Transcript_33064/g.54606 Transcript_33064/m.54606 type:complete len:344 (-) Transcript_33064:206-1237(-)